MQTRQLGNSDLSLTPLGIGAWAMGGNGWAFGWGAQDDADSIAAIREALDRGLNWIDTAAVYGLGHSEEVVAKALEGVAKNHLLEGSGRVQKRDQRGVGLLVAVIRIRPDGDEGRPGRGPLTVRRRWVRRRGSRLGVHVQARLE